MAGPYLVDTNVLVYAYDRSEPDKRASSLELLDRLALSGQGVLSLQILAEFFVAVTRNIAQPLSVALAEERILNYLRSWRTVGVTNMVFREAVRGVREHQLGFWDAQIWATARLNQIPTILSEDFSHGRTLEEVRFLNPFAPSFEALHRAGFFEGCLRCNLSNSAARALSRAISSACSSTCCFRRVTSSCNLNTSFFSPALPVSLTGA